MQVGQPEYVLVFDAVYAGIVNLLSIAVAFSFLVLGIILFRLLRKTDQLLTVNVEKKKSMAKVWEEICKEFVLFNRWKQTVFFVTALCTLCFAFRVIVSIYSMAREWDGSGTKGFDVPAEVFFLFFFLPEIIGSMMMLFLLRVPKVVTKRTVVSNVQEYRRIV